MTVSAATIQLEGKPLSFAAMRRIGSATAVPVADPQGMARIAAARRVVDRELESGLAVYGANTGVGAMKDTAWSQDDLDAFNLGLVRAHHFGTGPAFPASVVRNAMAIRINTALTGHVGCTPELIEAFLRLLASDVVPIVRRTGSIGCADIGLMGQIGAVLTGVGEALYRGRRLPAEEALAAAGISAATMAPRDALAALGTNAVGYAAAAEAVNRAAGVLRLMLATGLMTSAALGASRKPWRAAVAVGTKRQRALAGWMLQHSDGWSWPREETVHDPLSLRMIVQVLSAAFDGISDTGVTVAEATGTVDDNPVVAGGRVLTSGGSLPLDVAMAVQGAQLSIAHMARNAFNRLLLLGNGERRGLPVNLVPPGAIATGFGPVIKLAGELFTRVLTMADPVSPQSLVVARGIEDEAAFLPLIVERFERQVRALVRLAALEGILSAQAMDIKGDRPAGIVGFLYETVRAHCAVYAVDRPLSADVEALEAAFASPAFLRELISAAPVSEWDAFFALGTLH